MGAAMVLPPNNMGNRIGLAISIFLAVGSFTSGWLLEYKQIFVFKIKPTDALYLTQLFALLSAIFAKHFESQARGKSFRRRK